MLLATHEPKELCAALVARGRPLSSNAWDVGSTLATVRDGDD